MYFAENLKFCDFFGHKIDLRINENKKFKTPFGGVLSVTHLALCLFVFFTLSDNMINRTNPDVVSMTLFEEVPGISYYAKDSYFMMFGMQDPSWTFFIDETIFTTQMTQESHQPDGSTVTVPIPLERCTEDHLPPSVKVDLMNSVANLSNLYCIANAYDGVFYLNQVYGQEAYQQITISINICQNTTNNSNCKSPDEINNMLIGGFFGIQSADYIINPNNYNSPGQMFVRHYFVPTSPGLEKQYYRYLKTSYLESDEGWIINNVQTTPYTQFDSDRDFFDVYASADFTQDPTPRQIVYVEMEKSNYESYYIRTYEKIQTVLAQLGGFINILYIVFYLLTYPIKAKSFYDTMCNRLYNFEDSDMESTSTQGQKDEKGKKVNPQKAHMKSMKSTKDFDFCPKDQPVSVSYWDDFWAFCKSRSKIKTKIKQRNAAMRNLLEKMDLVYVLKKFLEIEKLKILLLNQDQYHLFDFFPKPYVTKTGHILLDYTGNNKKKKESTFAELSQFQIISNIDKLNKAVSIKKAYQNIKEKENHDAIDEKLLKLVDADIQALTKEKPNIFMNVTTLK